MTNEKFRIAGLAELEKIDDPARDRAMTMMELDSWGGSIGVHQGQDYIILNEPGYRNGTFICDDATHGISGRKIALAMLNIATHEMKREERERIQGANQRLAGETRNRATYFDNVSVSVAPSDTHEGRVRLNGWGEFTKGGVDVVFDALRAADQAINDWKVK